jgi:hypothetical protein
MDPVKLLHDRVPLDYDDDEEADVLYVSLGEPRPATGIELGAGTVLMFDEEAGQLVGLTVLGLRRQLERVLAEDDATARGIR